MGGVANLIEKIRVECSVEAFPIVPAALFRCLAQAEDDGVRRDEGIELTLGIGAIAGPAVLSGMRHHSGPYRVEFDIGVASQQIGGFCYQAGAKASLEQGACSPVEAVETLGIALAQALHHGADGMWIAAR